MKESLKWTHMISYKKRIPVTRIWVDVSFRTLEDQVLRQVKALREDPDVRDVTAFRLQSNQ